jgi:hypothetical protein
MMRAVPPTSESLQDPEQWTRGPGWLGQSGGLAPLAECRGLWMVGVEPLSLATAAVASLGIYFKIGRPRASEEAITAAVLPKLKALHRTIGPALRAVLGEHTSVERALRHRLPVLHNTYPSLRHARSLRSVRYCYVLPAAGLTGAI